MRHVDDPYDFSQVDWDAVRRKAMALQSDGCSGPTLPIYVQCCFQHDIAYRTHCDEHGAPITRKQADQRFRACMEHFSILGDHSLIAEWRYWAVRLFGWWAWINFEPCRTLKRLLFAVPRRSR